MSVPDDGVYRIRAGGRPGDAAPAVVLGRPVARRVLHLAVAVAGVVGGLGMGMLVGAAGLAMRRRAE